MTKILPIKDYKALLGQKLGTSSWVTIDQERINDFAEVTEDFQFIHVDPKLAQKTPFGGTIAHGYLTLSLLTKFALEVMPGIDGVVMGLNYGMNKVRFLNPVKVDQAIRANFVLKNVDEKVPGQYLSTTEVVIEIKGEEKPACIIEWLSLLITG